MSWHIELHTVQGHAVTAELPVDDLDLTEMIQVVWRDGASVAVLWTSAESAVVVPRDQVHYMLVRKEPS